MSQPHCVLYRDAEAVPVDQDPAAALAAARAEGGMLWIALDAPTFDEVTDLGRALGLDPLGVASVLRNNQRSKLEHFGDHLYLALQSAQYDDAAETVECHEVDVFVGDNLFVVFSPDGMVDLGKMRELLESHPEILKKGPYGVLWATLEYVTRGYRGVLDSIENDIDQIEEELFGEDAGVSRRIFALQREVIDLHHATAPLGDMLDRLQAIIGERQHTGSAPAFLEIGDRARYIDSRVVAFRTTLDSALTVHATLVDQRMTEQSIRQNDQTKKISAWAAIGFAPTLIAGIYGMNFQVMPELTWAWGYPFALGLMVTVGVVLYALFKKNDWI